MQKHDHLRQAMPDIRQRECGGWLAIAPPWSTVKIAVTGSSAAEVEAAFRRTMAEWAEMLDLEPVGR